jgi:hypothetical protein
VFIRDKVITEVLTTLQKSSDTLQKWLDDVVQKVVGRTEVLVPVKILFNQTINHKVVKDCIFRFSARSWGEWTRTSSYSSSMLMSCKAYNTGSDNQQQQVP